MKDCAFCKEKIDKKAETCPACGKKQPTFLQGCLVIVGGIFVFFMLGAIICGDSDKAESGAVDSSAFDRHAERAVGTLRTAAEGRKVVRPFVAAFAERNEIPASQVDGLFNCTSDNIFNKGQDLTLETVTTWCNDNRLNLSDKYLSENIHVNFYELDAHFSPWDGRHETFANLVKRSLHNPDSFEHVQTTRRITRPSGQPPRFRVVMDYSGTNLYNARVRQRAEALVDITTGQILQILSE